MEVFEKTSSGEAYEQTPPELPPPFETQLAYSQLVSELGPLVRQPELDTAEAQGHLHEIIDAAEKNEAIEGELERSHEIMKDQVATGELASSVGQILAQTHQPIPATSRSFILPRSPAPSFSTNSLRLLSRITPMYRQALISGLAGGMLVALIWLAMMLRAA